MYIENVTELAFDDITPEDPDFASIQGEKMRGIGYCCMAQSINLNISLDSIARWNLGFTVCLDLMTSGS